MFPSLFLLSMRRSMSIGKEFTQSMFRELSTTKDGSSTLLLPILAPHTMRSSSETADFWMLFKEDSCKEFCWEIEDTR